MISAFANPNQPPLISAEAQEPSMLRQGLANFQQAAGTPKGKVAMAMMQQQLGKMGTMFAPQPMTREPSPLDMYGQSPMMPPMMPITGPVSAPTGPQPDAAPSPMAQAPTTMNRFMSRSMPFGSEPVYRTDV